MKCSTTGAPDGILRVSSDHDRDSKESADWRTREERGEQTYWFNTKFQIRDDLHLLF
jgi:hypothetical protein